MKVACPALAALLLAGAYAGAAHAALVPYTSDGIFTSTANFTKYGGANVRWGNNATNGDWEYGVVNAGDIPYSQGNIAWTGLPGYASGSTTVSNHQFTFTYAATGAMSLALRNNSGTQIGTDTSPASGVQLTATGTFTPPTGGVNTLAVRARAASGDIATVGPGGTGAGIRVNFTSGGFFDIGRLVGDSDAEYLVLVDDRLAGGFSIVDNATMKDGSGSLPMWQFKVGVTPVPVPAALPLFAAGLGLLGWVGRRRR